MAIRQTTTLTQLRGRLWRLTVLGLWVAVLLVNLAVSLGALAAPAPSDLDTAICHASAAPDQPQPPASHPDHDAGPHCPLCYVVSAGLLSPSVGADLLMVLAPAPGWAGPVAEQLSPAELPVILPPSGPRAPPAFV
ncbi:MAG TPA: DUF2946 family protein [Magnetospirillum sp.]|jgi:hypothetical protein|nr:DUF2946 family protein [Magnetospirillum sp.]